MSASDSPKTKRPEPGVSFSPRKNALDEPSGAQAESRAALLAPILKQDQAISDHIRARRSVPDVDPKTGDEQPSAETTVDDISGGEPAAEDGN